jgi:IS30 family transposase
VSREVAATLRGADPTGGLRGAGGCPASHDDRAHSWTPRLWQYVQTQLTQGCSPEQIAGRLRHAYPDDMRKQLSTEILYAGLYVLPHGVLRSERLATLRQARKARRPRARGTDRRGQIPHMTSLVERPAEVATRTVPGRWEGDLIKGARYGSAVGTLVERTTRLVISWHGWRGRMRRVPARALPRHSDICPP